MSLPSRAASSATKSSDAILSEIRNLMQSADVNIAAYIITSVDAHQVRKKKHFAFINAVGSQAKPTSLLIRANIYRLVTNEYIMLVDSVDQLVRL